MSAQETRPAETLAEGRHLALRQTAGWEFVQRRSINGIVAVVAMTDDREVILVEQHRPPLQRRVIEWPAGLSGDQADVRDEPLLEAAKRELLEETGYTAAHWRQAIAGPTSAGLTDECIQFFLAGGLTRVGPGGGEPSENITVHLVPVLEIESFIRRCEAKDMLIDLKVYTGLYLLLTQSK